MSLYKIGKCDYCGDKNKILRPSPFMADSKAMMCEECWNGTQKEYENSNGECIPDFNSNKEEYKKAVNEIGLDKTINHNIDEKLITKTLTEKDWKLVESALMGHVVTITSTCMTCKDVMPEKTYNREMDESERLVYLINVLQGRKEYDLIKKIFSCNENGVTEWCVAKDKKQAYDFMSNLWGTGSMLDYEKEYFEDNPNDNIDDFIEYFFTDASEDENFIEQLKYVDTIPSYFGCEDY